MADTESDSDLQWKVMTPLATGREFTQVSTTQSRNQEFENGKAREIFRPMYRQDVSNVPTNIIKVKSKLTKPRA